MRLVSPGHELVLWALRQCQTAAAADSHPGGAIRPLPQLRFFSFADTYSLEGPCLVVYKDGHVAQGYVPENDFRCAAEAAVAFGAS